MKKTILALGLLLTAASRHSIAQSGAAGRELILPHMQQTAGQPAIGAKTTATASRLVAQSYYRYNLAGSAYTFSDSSNYVYSGARGGDLNNTQNYDARILLKQSVTGIRNNTRYAQSFDANNNLLVLLTQTWDTTSASWKNYSRTSYAYDAANLATGDTTQSWDAPTSTWVNSYAYAYSYNGSGKQIKYVGSTWSTASSQWSYSGQGLDTRDAAGNITEYISQTWTAGAWKNSSRNLYSYTSSNDVLSINYQSWDATAAAWKNTSGYPYTYNADGTEASQGVLTWNAAGNKWDTTGRYVSTYDAAKVVTMGIYQAYVITPPSYRNSNQYLYTNNSSGQRTSLITKTWNAGAFWELTGSDTRRSYYYETYSNSATGIAAIANIGGTLALFPVPASTVLNLQMKWNEPQDFTITILDMQGRMIQQWNRSAGGSYSDRIATSDIAAGTYSIILCGSKGGIQKRSFNGCTLSALPGLSS